MDAAGPNACPHEAEPEPVERRLVNWTENRVRRVGRVTGKPLDVAHRATSEVRVLPSSRVLAERSGRRLELLPLDAECCPQLLEGLR